MTGSKQRCSSMENCINTYPTALCLCFACSLLLQSPKNASSHAQTNIRSAAVIVSKRPSAVANA